MKKRDGFSKHVINFIEKIGFNAITGQAKNNNNNMNMNNMNNINNVNNINNQFNSIPILGNNMNFIQRDPNEQQ